MAEVEPMDVDNIASDFDDKENSFSLHSGNVISKTPNVEKGYEELDVSELNMKLRYSITPTNSPMSRSYTTNYKGDSGPNSLNNTLVADSSLTGSLNATLNKTDVFKPSKLPLQALPTSLYTNSDRRSCDREGDITVTISETQDDDNLSLPSTSSSAVQTPEATTPTKDIPKSEGSPIMRGLKSVLNMFRSSHSPVPSENVSHESLHHEYSAMDSASNPSIVATTSHYSTVEDNSFIKETSEKVYFQENSCIEIPAKETSVISTMNTELVSPEPLVCNVISAKDVQVNPVLASTPIPNSKLKDSKDSSKRNSPLKESVVFKEGLARELQWQKETEIFFKHEKIPVHKLLLQSGPLNVDSNPNMPVQNDDIDKKNTTVEYMDISNVDISYKSDSKSLNDIDIKTLNSEMNAAESDNEFLDCETSYTQNRSYILKTEVQNKVLPVVYQTDNILHESCFEDHITINECNNLNSDILNVDNNKTELAVQTSTNESNNLLPESQAKSLEFTKPNGTCESLNNNEIINVANVINSFPPTNIPCSIAESESKEVDNAKPNEVYSQAINLTFENNSKDDVMSKCAINLMPSETINPMTKIQSDLLQSVEDSNTFEMKIQSKNLIKESCVETIIDDKDFDVTMASNFSTNNMIMKSNDVINLDDSNTTQILFRIDELLLNDKTIAHFKKDMVLSNTETSNIGCKNTENFKYSVLNTKEEYLPDESKMMNDTVVITNNENTNEQITEQSFVLDQNIDDNGDSNYAKTSYQEFVKCDLQNTQVDKTSDINFAVDIKIDDPLHLLDEKENISKTECILNAANSIIITNDNKEPLLGLIHNDQNISPLQNIEGSQDIHMDNLEQNRDEIYVQQIHKTNEIDTTHLNDCRREQIYIDTITELNKSIEMKNNSAVDIPLPLDVPLPSDDDIENNSLLHTCSVKNNNSLGVESEVKIEKIPYVTKCDSSSELKEAINQSKTSGTFKLQNHDISLTDIVTTNSGECQTDFSIDIEMATVESRVQDIPFCQSSTNLTSCSQDLNLHTNHEDSQQTSEKITEITNDNYTIPSSDIANQPNNVNIKTTNIEVLEANNKNDLEIQRKTIDVDLNSKDFYDEIVTSTNNSPYVSISEVNLSTEELEGQLEPVVITVGSPPISPKLPNKGYNINFDEIENPFATKTNIRMSPPLGTSSRSFTPISNNQKSKDVQKKRPLNRGITQSEGKKKDTNKRRFNTSMNSTVMNIKKSYIGDTNKFSSNVNNSSEDNKIGQEKVVCDVSTVHDLQKHINAYEKNYVENSHSFTLAKASTDLEIQQSFDKNILPEHSTINKPETKSINIPKIDDVNFNPKSRTHVTEGSGPSELNDTLQVKNDNEIATEQLNNTVCIDNNENASVSTDNSLQDVMKVSSNTSNLTSSSINTEDKEVTIREVNTEDEDTIEGPFFEAEDLVDVVKVPEIEIQKHTEHFVEPITPNNEYIDKAELFIDAEALEFLLNQNKSNIVADSGNESLFLKFDPLFAKRVSSDGALTALSAIQKKQSTPKKLTRPPIVKLGQEETFIPPLAGPSNIAPLPEVSHEEVVNAISKPMMIVNPAIAKQPAATPRISLTPKTNRQSLNFASPAMVVIDRLLSLSGNTSLLDPNITTETSRNHEANIVLVQLRELLAEKEIHVHSLKCESKELRERLNMLESQVRNLENEGEERLKKVTMLNERLAEKTKINKSMAVVVEEYERTIASLIAEMEQEKKRNAEERMRLMNERDEQTAHLASMEGSFSDLNSKYEKCKQIILSMKANEDGYKKSFKEFDENLLKMQKNYDLLKQHATSKLNHANQELEKMNRAHSAEILKLTAIIKRKDLHVVSLEESLAQKSKANEELSAICDELISKVG